MGGGDSGPPEQSDEEKALLATQTKILNQQLTLMQQQADQFKLLSPYMFEDLGLKPKLDDKGNITGFEEIPDEIKPLRQKSEKLLLERSIAALEGRLPVSEQLTQELQKGRETLEEGLRRSLGPDFLASTGGSKAMADFEREEKNILEASRRGDITLAEQLGMARSASNASLTSNTLANVLGLNNQIGNIAGGFGATAQGFNGPISSWANSRRMDGAASPGGGLSAMLGGIGQLGGTVVGSIYGGPAGGAVGGAAGGAAGSMLGSVFGG